jgi:LuxR family maltose regulon positive regulatory protein
MDALAAAQSAAPRCVRHRVVRNLMQARAAPSDEAALDHVTAAVREASAAGIRQSVAAEMTDRFTLVEMAGWASSPDWLDSVRRLTAVSGDWIPPEAWPAVDKLSPREREVLRMLSSRLMTREIAAELGVSVNTVKYHMKNIYRKLGVRSRVEAATVARQMAGSGWPRSSGGSAITQRTASRGPTRA